MKASMMTDFNKIKATAIALLSDPSRKFGRAGFHTLQDVVGIALVKATESAPLNSEDFERARYDIVQALRTPTNKQGM
jgi:hypothetical protein